MGTPFIKLLEPALARLDGYDKALPHDQQPAHIPPTFTDAMAVREAVFVGEQGVPLEYEHDADDARSCHWVLYASVNRVVEPEQLDESGNVVRPRRSETSSVPVGTLRIVPFPHPPHPEDGSVYVDNVLQQPQQPQRESESKSKPEPPLLASSTGGGGGGSSSSSPPHPTAAAAPVAAPVAASAPAAADQQRPGASTTTNTTTTTTTASSSSSAAANEQRQSAGLPFGQDRATTLHDGREAYVKLGRVAVLRDFRGRGVAAQLWRAAADWLRQNPAHFDPSVAELSMDLLMRAGAGAGAGTTGAERRGVRGTTAGTTVGPGAAEVIPRWGGLVCTHAQEAVVAVYERWGFRVDEGMGRWTEEGIPHVGMFQRLQVEETTPLVV
ncbi:acetyltransferase [Xylariaceae sp. FL0804]|nr:acetyltransferase [Xylariaceae sp. FL0804]